MAGLGYFASNIRLSLSGQNAAPTECHLCFLAFVETVVSHVLIQKSFGSTYPIKNGLGIICCKMCTNFLLIYLSDTITYNKQILHTVQKKSLHFVPANLRPHAH